MTSARADVVSVQAKAAATVVTSSNPLLSTSGSGTVAGVITSPQVRINADVPNFHADWDNRLDLNAYDQPGYSSADLHSKLGALWTGQTWTAGLTGGYDRDTTRTSELGASGVNVLGIRHIGLAFAPRFAWRFTQVDEATVADAYSSGRYEATSIYNDYRANTLTLGYRHHVNAANAVFLNIGTGRYWTTSGSPQSATSVQPMVGWKREVSSALSASASVGGISSRTQLPQGETTARALAFEANLDYATARDLLHVRAGRNPMPLGSGGLAIQTNMTVENLHEFSPTTDGGLALQYAVNKYSVYSPYSARNYLSVAPKLDFHLYRDLVLTVGYQFQRETYEAGGVANSNSVRIGLVLMPRQLAMGL